MLPNSQPPGKLLIQVTFGSKTVGILRSPFPLLVSVAFKRVRFSVPHVTSSCRPTHRRAPTTPPPLSLILTQEPASFSPRVSWVSWHLEGRWRIGDRECGKTRLVCALAATHPERGPWPQSDTRGRPSPTSPEAHISYRPSQPI